MSIKPDHWIRQLAEQGMIDPFAAEQVRDGVISYGVSSYGYDMRIADEFKVLSARALTEQWTVDVKNPRPGLYETVSGVSYIDIPGNNYVLGRSVERFSIPRDVICICLGKSTYARVSVHPHITPLEPGWEGYVTLEIANTGPLPVRIYANEGIAQVLFFQGDGMCEVSYADKQGKYQDQQGVVEARV